MPKSDINSNKQKNIKLDKIITEQYNSRRGCSAAAPIQQHS